MVFLHEISNRKYVSPIENWFLNIFNRVSFVHESFVFEVKSSKNLKYFLSGGLFSWSPLYIYIAIKWV